MEKDTNKTLLDVFEEKYVGLYRWLLLLIGCLSLVGLIGMSAFLFWSTSKTLKEPSADFFSKPSWQSVRREVLPLVVKPRERTLDRAPLPEVQERPINPLVEEIRTNLLRQFDAIEMETAELYFPKRLLNEWLMEEAAIQPEWRSQFLQDLTQAAALIGEDERIKRIGSVDGRAGTIMTAFDAYVTEYISNVNLAYETVDQKLQQDASRKAALTDQIFIAIPIMVAIFLSMIGLILLIRMELHLRQFVGDYRSRHA